MNDAMERCAQAGVARCVIARLLTEVDALGSILHRCVGLVDRFQASSEALRTRSDSRGRLELVDGHP